jgi:nanoRNase/pAp phosphatase (c-di-AMP/oligoRNAs hydrolase)
MRVDGVEWVIAAGRYKDGLYISLRTFDPGAHAGDLVQDVVRERGSAGGHGEMAGARIDVSRLSAVEYEELLDSLFEEFCDQLGVFDQPRIPLIPTDTAEEPEPGPDPADET